MDISQRCGSSTASSTIPARCIRNTGFRCHPYPSDRLLSLESAEITTTACMRCNILCLLKILHSILAKPSSASRWHRNLSLKGEGSIGADHIKIHYTDIFTLGIELEDYRFAICYTISIRFNQSCHHICAIDAIV